MNRLIALAGALTLAVIVTGTSAKAEDDKIPEISEIMKKGHGKDGFLKNSVPKAIKAGEWEEATKEVKEWQKLGDALAKNKPEKGSEASWKSLTTKYNKALKGLATAVDKKDETAANKSLKAIGSSCGGCHKVHKP